MNSATKIKTCSLSFIDAFISCVVQENPKLPFFGFGGGARLCPGMDLARAELCLFLHHLVMKFE